ncbi:hypothetical protein WJX84_005881 [Apatococcus fuscideae]|uniref:Uncharacterized protein n=1 Tax=Apatococcus fuscideae TaxID=2026836 RepID=A0AAW1T0W8_9CHLO
MELCTSLPAAAELQTVAPSTATEVAKPLKSQPVDKNKIWLLFGAGAAGVFGTAVLLENNERLFPAIAKANKAMRMAQQMRESGVNKEEPPIETTAAEPSEDPSQSAFAAGLKEASQKAKAQSTSSQTAEAASPPQPDEPANGPNNGHAEAPHAAQVLHGPLKK